MLNGLDCGVVAGTYDQCTLYVSNIAVILAISRAHCCQMSGRNTRIQTKVRHRVADCQLASNEAVDGIEAGQGPTTEFATSSYHIRGR